MEQFKRGDSMSIKLLIALLILTSTGAWAGDLSKFREVPRIRPCQPGYAHTWIEAIPATNPPTLVQKCYPYEKPKDPKAPVQLIDPP